MHAHTQTGYWGTLGESEDRLFLYPCPPGYCRCEMRVMGSSTDCISVFDSTASGSDSQCNCDRQGIYMYVCVCIIWANGYKILSILYTGELCGKCRGGKGVSVLLNKCTTCSDASSLLIITMGEKFSVSI